MRRLLGSMIVLLPLFFTAGCVICDSPFDKHSAASGGSIQRADPASGRVNSAFAPKPTAADPLAPSTPGVQADTHFFDRGTPSF